MNSRFYIPLLLVLGGLPLSVAWGAANPSPAPEAEAPSSVRALLTPNQEATLSSQIGGRILSIPLDEGGVFKSGESLVQFDCRQQEAELNKARALMDGKSKLFEANLKLKRLGSISEPELAASEAEVKQAYAEATVAETRTSMCQIQAPFAGRVVKRRAQPFETVAAGAPLLEVVDDSRLRVQLIVPSRWLAWLKPGAGFSVQVDETGKAYPARLTALGARVDPVSQTLEVKGEVVGQFPELLAGMSGTALFTTPSR